MVLSRPQHPSLRRTLAPKHIEQATRGVQRQLGSRELRRINDARLDCLPIELGGAFIASVYRAMQETNLPYADGFDILARQLPWLSWVRMCLREPLVERKNLNKSLYFWVNDRL